MPILLTNGDFDIFTVSETWFNSSVHNNEINISGYRVVRLHRALRSGAGVCAYVRSSLKVNILRDITLISDDGFQQLWFTVQHKKLRSLDICVAYRPPDVSLVSFASELTSTYSQAAMLGKDIIILGDLNCNVFADSTEAHVLKDVISMLNLTNLISSPTRVTDKSATLIDVMLTSNADLVKSSGVLRTLISDHYLVHCTLNLKLPKDKPVTITARSYKNFDVYEFFDDVSKVPWDIVSLFEHIDDQVSCFNDLFLGVLDQHAPA